MARSFLALALTSLLSTGLALAQPAPSCTPSPSPLPGEGKRPKKDRDGRENDRRPPMPPVDREGPLGRFKKKLEQMTPEERQHFQDNWKRWREMNDGERRDWQKRAMDEREHLKHNIDDAIAALGLKLDADRREVFALRYRQERRKLEQQISEETEAKRKAGIDDILARLKAEFSTPKPAPAATPAPAR